MIQKDRRRYIRSTRRGVALLGTVVSLVAGGLGIREYLDRRPAAEINGAWTVTNTIDGTSLSSYQGLRLGYRIFLRQDGKSFSGVGEKISENERELAGRARTPIRLDGYLKGNTVKATFIEEGTRRQTAGTWSWTVDRSGKKMVGTFSHTAANSSGGSVAER